MFIPDPNVVHICPYLTYDRPDPQLSDADPQPCYKGNWFIFKPPPPGPPLIRNKMKAALKAAGRLPGVQVEIAGDRLWFRLAVTKKTKDRLKVSRNFQNLCK